MIQPLSGRWLITVAITESAISSSVQPPRLALTRTWKPQRHARASATQDRYTATVRSAVVTTLTFGQTNPHARSISAGAHTATRTSPPHRRVHNSTQP